MLFTKESIQKLISVPFFSQENLIWLPDPQVIESHMIKWSDVFRICSILFFVGMSCSYSVIAANTSEPDTAFMDLTSSKSVVEVGDTILVEGYIVPSLLSRPGDRVLLQVTSPKESRADTYYQLKTSTEGLFNIEFQVDAIGDWNFQARYSEYASPVVPVKVTPRAKVKETELTISGPFNRVFMGESGQMSGWLRDYEGNGIPYREVWYSFGLPSYSCVLCEDDARRIWQTLGPVTTDEIGYFEFSFPARDKGTYAVKASFPGDEIFAKAESETVYPNVL
ncbi:MAG: hypothetical protein BWY45_01637 [Euryarchaeota archaeon ADurb.Bin294]|nr:MAG: hypothetical protein BWY45_01637 [Euryarchaeota archaeon ADurb.Bin294]